MFAGSETFHFLSHSKLHIDDVRGDILTRRLGTQPSRRNVFRHTHAHPNAHTLTHTLKASPARGVEMLVSPEMPVQTLSSPFTHTHTHTRDKRADKWMR